MPSADNRLKLLAVENMEIEQPMYAKSHVKNGPLNYSNTKTSKRQREDTDLNFDDDDDDDDGGGGEEDQENDSNSSAEEVDIYERSSSPLRWLILVLTVLLLMGPYYAYDNPGATQVSLRDYFNIPASVNENSTVTQNQTFQDFNVKFQLLYSTYSLPNTVWPVVAGALVDKLGARASNIASTSISLVGHALVAGGISLQSWYLAWTGRGVFGIGTELMCVSGRMLVANWFLGGKGEIALAMGVLLATGRLSSVLNDAISGVFDGDHVAQAYYVGVAFCGMSVLAATVAFLVDRRHQRKVDARVAMAVYGDRAELESGIGGGGKSKIHDMKGKETVDDQEEEEEEEKESSSSSSTPQLLSFKVIATQVKGWKWSFWLLCGLCVTGYCMVVAFNNVASAFLEDRYAASGEEASSERVNAAMAILFLSAAIAATFAGSIVDATGCRAGYMLAAAILVFASHTTLAFTTMGSPLPEILFAVMGISFALFAAALWPAVAFVIPKPGLGLAYGIMGASQNIGLVITPLVTSELQPPACSGKYVCVCMLFAGIAAAAILLCVLFLIDEARGWGRRGGGKNNTKRRTTTITTTTMGRRKKNNEKGFSEMQE